MLHLCGCPTRHNVRASFSWFARLRLVSGFSSRFPPASSGCLWFPVFEPFLLVPRVFAGARFLSRFSAIFRWFPVFERFSCVVRCRLVSCFEPVFRGCPLVSGFATAPLPTSVFPRAFVHRSILYSIQKYIDYKVNSSKLLDWSF